MKTIFYKQNKIIITDTIPSEEVNTIFDPGMKELKDLFTHFLTSNPYEIYLIGDIKKILKKIKSFFKNIKAAGGLVINPQNEILLIKRLGVWDLPKGKLEKSETKREGALREVEEECGIKKLKIIKKLGPTYHVYPLKKNWILKTSYWYLMQYNGNETPIPQTEEDIEEVIWVEKEKILNKLYPAYPAIEMVLHQFLSPSE